MSEPHRRIVKIFIVDPDENVPLEQCLLHRSEEKFTDLTDQELFFELDIKNMLQDHNADRERTEETNESIGKEGGDREPTEG